MIYIYEIHLDGGRTHEHITAVRWRNLDSGQFGESSRQEIIDWLREPGHRAYVAAGRKAPAQVAVVPRTPPHIRTRAEGSWTDNLLALPHY